MSNPHRGLVPETRGSVADAPIVIIAVHGRGQTPAYLLEHLVAPLENDRPSTADEVAWVLPSAAESSWYPNGFLAPLDDNQPWLDHALDVMVDMEAMVADRPPTSVIWAGFSQGACLVSEHLARRPQRWGGLLAFTGGMIGPEGTELAVAGSFEGMPAYFGVGDHDDWVPESRVHETTEAYRAAGAEVTFEVFPGRDHVISEPEIAQAAALLDTTLRS